MSKYVFLGSFPDIVRHSRLGWWRPPADRWWLDKLQRPLDQSVARLFDGSDAVPCVVSGVLRVIAGACFAEDGLVDWGHEAEFLHRCALCLRDQLEHTAMHTCLRLTL